LPSDRMRRTACGISPSSACGAATADRLLVVSGRLVLRGLCSIFVGPICLPHLTFSTATTRLPLACQVLPQELLRRSERSRPALSHSVAIPYFSEYQVFNFRTNPAPGPVWAARLTLQRR